MKDLVAHHGVGLQSGEREKIFIKRPSQGRRAFCFAASEQPGTVKASSASKRQAKSLTKSLTDIPGVGPKNAQLLVAAGYTDVEGIQNFYVSQCQRDAELLQKHLQGEVGIRSRKHQQMIAEYVASVKDGKKEFVTLSVEGNISSGKSTFLQGVAANCPTLQDRIHVAPEPVWRWQNVGGTTGHNGHNLLDKFYNDKERYAYTFQNYIFFTRMMQEQESANAMKAQPYRLLERSIFCDRMVFVESLKDSKIMSEMELSIYNSWFDPVVEMAPTLVPDGFIYLRAQPQTCMSRMQHRSRSEETGVSIDYLQDLHQRHEDWLCNELDKAGLPPPPQAQDLEAKLMGGQKTRTTLEYIRDQLYTEPTAPSLIEHDVRLLDQSQNSLLHNSIDKLPALVLDCEKELQDLDAQREHADKVNCYFEWVKESRKVRYQRRMFDNVIGHSYPEIGASMKQQARMNIPEEWRHEAVETIEGTVKRLAEMKSMEWRVPEKGLAMVA